MKKYLGLIKICEENMSGTNIRILSKTYDKIKFLNMWFNIYPNSEHIILDNTEELDSIFSSFEDMTPITIEEKEEMEKGKSMYKKLMNDQ